MKIVRRVLVGNPDKYGIVKLHFGQWWSFRLFIGQGFLELGTIGSGLYLQKKGWRRL